MLTAPASSFSRICSVGRALPDHYASQEVIKNALRRLWAERHYNADRFDALHDAVRVEGRYLAVPVDEYERLDTFAKRNEAWARVALEIGERAIREALKHAGLTPSDIDHLFFVTVTGIMTPSLDALLVNRLGFRSDVKRTPIFGLGCVAGAAGIARAADFLRAFPENRALLLSVELCSLTMQRDDLSVPNVIATGLFGDGAAAVVLGGGATTTKGNERNEKTATGPRVLATQSVFYPDTERMMGWDIVEGGFKLVLSAQVPALVREKMRGNIDTFLASHGLDRTAIHHWIAHTGGPKVLEAFAEALELPPGALDRSWGSLRKMGNLSSASVLFVLGETLQEANAKPGDYGVLLAMGPGFCAELVLLRW